MSIFLVDLNTKRNSISLENNCLSYTTNYATGEVVDIQIQTTATRLVVFNLIVAKLLIIY